MDVSDLQSSPFVQFQRWFQVAAEEPEIAEANACFLATATSEGYPSLRTVLLKEVDDRGFVFFTNYESRKSQELIQNFHAALLFYWPKFYRQIRIEGDVEKISVEESDDYFQSRPRGSQIGAHVSPQSQIIPSRDFLMEKFQTFEQEHINKEISRPQHWGGFRIVANYFEFWEGQENRLHDRFAYFWRNQQWLIERLAP